MPVDAAVISTPFLATADSTRRGPAMNIPAVPESIPFSRVAEFLTSVGIDISEVLRSTPITIGYDGIQCEVRARNADGQMYVNPDGETLATHRISIPLVDEEQGSSVA